MTNSLMSRCNMQGGKGKMAYDQTSLKGVIVASVMKTRGNCCSKEVSKEIAHCLKYAPDQKGGGGRGNSRRKKTF